MSVETFSLSPTPLRACCFRRRLAFCGSTTYYSDRSAVTASTGGTAFEMGSEICDIVARGDSLFAIDSAGDIAHISGDSSSATNSVSRKCGLFSALESTDNFVVAAHDLSHSVRFVDCAGARTVSAVELPGLLSGLSKSRGDVVIASDDQSLSVIDPRTDGVAARSGALVSRPRAVLGVQEKIAVSGEDRRVRIFDLRKLKTPLVTTKPSTKNGTVAMYADNAEEIVCVGCDEAMTLVECKRDIGQIKRAKYLAETPWISAPVLDGEGKLCLLTRGGVVHRFTDPIEFLKKRAK